MSFYTVPRMPAHLSECFMGAFRIAPAPELLTALSISSFWLADVDLKRERPQLPTCENGLLFSWKKKKVFKKDQQLRTEVSIVCIITES